MQGGKKEQTVTDFVRSIIQPVAEQVAAARELSNGIVFVAHKPTGIAVAALEKLQAPYSLDGTSVWATTCYDAANMAPHDPVTKEWCETPPEEDQIKVFLIADAGAMLVTLRFEEDQVFVEVERRKNVLH